MISPKDADSGLVKVLFRLERDARGWPPLDVEGMWAKRTSETECVLHNIPFYAQGVANGDVVSVVAINEELYFSQLLREGGHGTIRILVKGSEQVGAIIDMLESFGCGVEVAEPRLIAVDVQPNVPVAALLKYLDAEEAAQRFGYEISCKSW